MRSRLRRIPSPLLILLAIAALHGTAWSVATAPLQGPDEIAHAAYVQYLAETGDGPDKDQGAGAVSTSLNVLMTELNLSPIIGHLEGRPFWERADDVAKHADELGDDAYANGSGPNAAGNYPPGYYVYAALAFKLSPDRDLLGRFTAVRLATVLLFVATVLLAWLLFGELFRTRWKQTFATGLVALHPKLGFMAGLVNPDLAITAIGTATLLGAVKAVKHGPSPRNALALGLLAALAALTHPRGLFIPPFAVLAFALAVVRHRPPLPRLALGSAIVAAPVAVGGLLAVLYTRGHAGGAAFGTGSPVSAFNAREFVSYVWQFYFPRLAEMAPKVGPPDYGYRQVWVETFFGTFGSLEVNYAGWVYDLLQVGAALGFVALYTAVAFRWRAVLSNAALVALLAVFFAGLMGLLHIVSYGALRGDGVDPVITGRYLLPAVTVFAGAVAFVVGSLPRRVAPYFAGGLLAAFALMSLSGVALSLERFHG